MTKRWETKYLELVDKYMHYVTCELYPQADRIFKAMEQMNRLDNQITTCGPTLSGRDAFSDGSISQNSLDETSLTTPTMGAKENENE